ncbi:hypothetical protein LWI28_013325 [Acer negundo]|uniref:Reverse transcriptase domain-containing protein n=1 Tax=Acer negundo TaxID=4023 RepID=A0AAD5IMA5_ACENE|nr:hypothetical protein LWI28_013325 [Acer negundo]
MPSRFHILGGINDPSLKHIYLSSLPQELQDDVQRRLDTSGKSIADTTLGEIHMYTIGALDKLCATQKKGHYAKNCPMAKSTKLVCQLEQVANDVPSDVDLESIFSEQEGVDNNTTFVLHDTDSAFSSDTSKFSDSDVLDSYQAIQVDSSSGPHVPIQILPERFSKPIDAIAYIDIGSHTIMMNPKVLPPTAWKPYFRYFKAADVLPFGLKTAPSLFQKAVTRIFYPLLHSALLYIDDILLFSPDENSHSHLLYQFHHIVDQHGIMLSEKKNVIGQWQIDFLGMHISDGQYRLGPHLVVQLLDFPDSHLTTKQVQQFLGIVNSIRDFLHQVSRYTSVLSSLLKKTPPPWDSSHTDTVTKLKVMA